MKSKENISSLIKESQLYTSDQFTDQLMLMIEKESQAVSLSFWTAFFHNFLLIVCFGSLAYCAFKLNEQISLLNNKTLLISLPAFALLVILIVIYRNIRAYSKPLLQ